MAALNQRQRKNMVSVAAEELDVTWPTDLMGIGWLRIEKQSAPLPESDRLSLSRV